MLNQAIPLPHDLNESYRIAVRLLHELREIQVLSTYRRNSLTAEDVTAVVPALQELARSASNMFTLAEQLRDSLSSTAHTIQWATSEKGRNATGRVEVQTTQGVVRETTVVEAILELGRVWWCTSMHVADEADKVLAAIAAGDRPDAATIAAICHHLESEARIDDEQLAKLKVDLKREYMDVASVVQHFDMRAPREPSERGRPAIKRPSHKAFKAWFTRDVLGVATQAEIAEEMTKLGCPANQGQVSRWLKQVDGNGVLVAGAFKRWVSSAG